ncbi:MAG: ABC transporter permease [Planctomycetaceae bacterium]
MRFLLLAFDNLRRNVARTIFTSLATMVMVLVVVCVLSILTFLSNVTTEKAANLKAIITERWQIPSQMPFAYASGLSEGAPHRPGDIRVAPNNAMTWSFFVGATDPDSSKRSNETFMFAFAMKPRSALTMMDGFEDLEGAEREHLEKGVQLLEARRDGLIIGKERLKSLGRQVGDRLKIYGLNYKEIDLEFEILDVLPEGRNDQISIMNIDYLMNAIDAYPQSHAGQAHPMANKSLNLVWLRMADQPTFQQVADQIMTNPAYQSPVAVKIETASSGIGTFLEAYRDLIWGMRWLLSPAILFTLSLVISNSISISVRERRLEFAVLKVLGFRPWQILSLVLCEALLIGTLSGLFSAGATYLLVNFVFGGLKFPIAFFPVFLISNSAWWWGAAIGAGTAFLGSIWPAWSARMVKVADVFSNVA